MKPHASRRRKRHAKLLASPLEYCRRGEARAFGTNHGRVGGHAARLRLSARLRFRVALCRLNAVWRFYSTARIAPSRFISAAMYTDIRAVRAARERAQRTCLRRTIFGFCCARRITRLCTAGVASSFSLADSWCIGCSLQLARNEERDHYFHEGPVQTLGSRRPGSVRVLR